MDSVIVSLSRTGRYADCVSLDSKAAQCSSVTGTMNVILRVPIDSPPRAEYIRPSMSCT